LDEKMTTEKKNDSQDVWGAAFRHIKYLGLVYGVGMVFFTLYRLSLFLVNYKQLAPIPSGRISLVLQAFVMGFRFDTVISGYLLGIPFLVLSLAALAGFYHRYLHQAVTIYLGLLYSLAFAICCVDIPYFGYTNTHLSAVLLNWFNNADFLLKMTIQEKSYWGFFLAFFLLAGLFWFLLIKFRKRFFPVNWKRPVGRRFSHVLPTFGISFIFLLLLFIGVRGRLVIKSPIRVGTAYFSAYSFPNQLGLNPVFTFFRGVLDERQLKGQEISLLDDETAIRQAREYLGLDPANRPFLSPIARQVKTAGEPVAANVVLVIMESMAAARMQRYGCPYSLTPNLERLAGNGYAFDRAYGAGPHTYNGIFAVLFSFCAVKRQHPMKAVSMLSYASLPATLKENGYNTAYFTTHDDQFDNIGGFLRANGVNEIIGQKDYPRDRVLSTLGVPDDFMFTFSLPRLNALHEKGKPFLAVFLTGSAHPPYILPDYWPPRPEGLDVSLQVVTYADWAIGQFLDQCSRQPWFENTIFVFVADHGLNLDPVYDMPLSYYHLPLIFYSPGLIKEHRAFAQLAGQIDIFPTIMGLLNIPYVNNTLGIDLLREKRPFIFFNDENKIGCLDGQYFLVARDNGINSLYAYTTQDTGDYLPENKELAKRMEQYAFSMLQTTQWLIKHHLVGKPSVKK